MIECRYFGIDCYNFLYLNNRNDKISGKLKDAKMFSEEKKLIFTLPWGKYTCPIEASLQSNVVKKI